MYKLIAFDMDGTLINYGSCWWEIHKRFNTYEKSLENYKEFQENKINYSQWMRKDASLWNNPHISKLENIFENYELVPNAKEVLTELNKKYKTCIITCGLDFIANKVAKDLDIDIVLANGLELDKNGYITGKDICRVSLERKHLIFKELVNDLGIDIKESVAIGDSKWDAEFLKVAGLGIAFGNDSELRKVANHVIYDLKDILKIL